MAGGALKIEQLKLILVSVGPQTVSAFIFCLACFPAYVIQPAVKKPTVMYGLNCTWLSRDGKMQLPTVRVNIGTTQYVLDANNYPRCLLY